MVTVQIWHLEPACASHILVISFLQDRIGSMLGGHYDCDPPASRWKMGACKCCESEIGNGKFMKVHKSAQDTDSKKRT